MTRKSLDKIVDKMIEDVCSRKGLNPAIGVKGGEAEIAHALLSLSFSKHREQILTDAGAPAPAV